MTVPSTTRRRPAGRYDPPSLLGQRVLAVLMTVLLLALLAAGASFLWSRFGGEQVRGQVLSYEVVSDREVSVEVEVSKTPGAKAYCVVRARDRAGLEVGRDVAVLDAEGTSSRTARGTFSLRTTATAVTGELAGCTATPISADDPPR